MAGQIRMSSIPEIPKNPEFLNVQVKNINQNDCVISFELVNYVENTPVFITLNNMTRKEITTAMKKVDTHYEYTLNELNADSRYSFYLSAKTTKGEFLSNIYSFATIKITVYGVQVDESNINYSKAVSYIEDAIGFTPATNTELNSFLSIYPFNKIRVVGFKNGQVTKEINKTNKKYYIDGSAVPNDVDVMVEIPNFYWDFEKTQNGYKMKVSDKKFNNTCDCYAHKVNETKRDCIYIGAYKGYIENNKMRSISDVVPTGNLTGKKLRDAAVNVGKGYGLISWNAKNALKILYLLCFKDLDSQNALGKGYLGEQYSGGTTSPLKTGTTNNKWPFYGSKTSTTERVMFLGIEDIYGNLDEITDGIIFDKNNCLKVCTNNYDFLNRNSYKTIKENLEIPRHAFYDFTSKVLAINEAPFVGIEFGRGGYDTMSLSNGTFSVIDGGAFNKASYGEQENVGIFSFTSGDDHETSPSSYMSYGSRLCYLGTPLEITYSFIDNTGETFLNICSDYPLTEVSISFNNKTYDINFNKEKEVWRKEEIRTFEIGSAAVGTKVVFKVTNKKGEVCTKEDVVRDHAGSPIG